MGRNFCVLKTCDRVHCLGLEQGTSRGGGNPLGGLRDSWAHPAPIHRLPFVVCFKQMVAYFFPVYTWGPQPSVQADPALGTHRLLSGGRGWHDLPPPAWGGWLLAGWSAELLWGRSLREGQARVPPPRLSVTVSLPLPAQVGGLPSLPVSTAPGSWGVWRSPEGAKGLPAGARLAQSWGEAEWLRGGVAVRRGEGRGSMWGGHSQVMLTESPPRSAGHPPPPTPHGFRAVSPPARVGFCTPAPKGPGVRRPGAPVAALGPAACEQPGAGQRQLCRGTASPPPGHLVTQACPPGGPSPASLPQVRCPSAGLTADPAGRSICVLAPRHSACSTVPSPCRTCLSRQSLLGRTGAEGAWKGGAEAARVDPRAAVTKRHRRGGLKRHFLPHSSEGGKSELKVSTELPRPRSLRGASLVPLPAAGGCRHTSHASARGGCTPISASVFTWLRPSRCP